MTEILLIPASRRVGDCWLSDEFSSENFPQCQRDFSSKFPLLLRVSLVSNNHCCGDIQTWLPCLEWENSTSRSQHQSFLRAETFVGTHRSSTPLSLQSRFSSPPRVLFFKALLGKPPPTQISIPESTPREPDPRTPLTHSENCDNVIGLKLGFIPNHPGAGAKHKFSKLKKEGYSWASNCKHRRVHSPTCFISDIADGWGRGEVRQLWAR